MILFLKKNKPFKYLIYKKNSRSNGKNFSLVISKNKGGGTSIKYRSIDFYKFLWNIYGIVLSIEYNPYNHKLISLVFYLNGIFSYILYIKNLKIGSIIISSHKTNLNLGNSLYLKYIPYGTYIHNLEIYPKHGSQLIKSSGSFAKVLSKYKKYIKLKLKSGEKKFFHQFNFATIGVISDFLHLYKIYNLNAGFNRRIGWKPHVRGVAMNAVDHPNGGGKGKKSGKKVIPLGKIIKKNKI